ASSSSFARRPKLRISSRAQGVDLLNQLTFAPLFLHWFPSLLLFLELVVSLPCFTAVAPSVLLHRVFSISRYRFCSA
ncbi:hypothetical protein PIB30_082792, partial [Stylosanthes scabra]|nr:hypothetical protein [Stylosanthes scabra]